jgi:hypothetical protein
MGNLRRWLGECYRHNIKSFIALCKRVRYLWLISFFLSDPVSAAFERLTGPLAIMGYAAVGSAARSTGAISLNPSGIGALQTYRLTLFYSPSPFGLPQLSNGGLSAAIPLGPAVARVAFRSSGFALYREWTGTVTGGGMPMEGLLVGAAVNVNHLSIDRYGSATAIGCDLGFSITLAKGIHWGAAFLNANRPVLGAARDVLPQYYLTGLVYEAGDDAVLGCTLTKDSRYAASVRVGAEVKPLDFLSLRLAVATDPSRYCAGVEIHALSVHIMYAVATHSELGLEHSIVCSIDW